MTLKTSIKSILMVDPEEVNNDSLIESFKKHGVSIKIVTINYGPLADLKNLTFDCLMINSDLIGGQALKLLEKVKWEKPEIIVIMLLNTSKTERIFELVRHGADDFLMKPFSWDEIEKLLTHYNY
jgi:DNA-binding NtrC family response regulator